MTALVVRTRSKEFMLKPMSLSPESNSKKKSPRCGQVTTVPILRAFVVALAQVAGDVGRPWMAG